MPTPFSGSWWRSFPWSPPPEPAWRSAREPARAPARRRARGPARSVYTQALLGNVRNPKAASIYLTLVPQFVEADRSLDAQILTLASAHALLMALWLLARTVLVQRAARTLREPRFRRLTARVTAVVFLALGIRTAVR
ncbi:LysE family translocator [Streptomyces hainanensis]|uniref:LysE family translocator n=1 Tax=Streptomyces hainanensis TaxID=402648 RepID=UPI001FB81CE3|nr:LysE family transporter [Streptomyces hainanensis]